MLSIVRPNECDFLSKESKAGRLRRPLQDRRCLQPNICAIDTDHTANVTHSGESQANDGVRTSNDACHDTKIVASLVANDHPAGEEETTCSVTNCVDSVSEIEQRTEGSTFDARHWQDNEVAKESLPSAKSNRVNTKCSKSFGKLGTNQEWLDEVDNISDDTRTQQLVVKDTPPTVPTPKRSTSWLSLFQCGKKNRRGSDSSCSSNSDGGCRMIEAIQDNVVPKKKRRRLHENLGLRNLGNTCYMNSAIQMLVSVSGFVADLKTYDDVIDASRDIDEYAVGKALLKEISGEMEEKVIKDNGESSLNEHHTTEGKNSLRREFLQLARSMRIGRKDFELGNTDCDGEYSCNASSISVDPSNFKTAMDEVNAMFEGYQQHDSHEFLSALLDLLQDEIDDEIKRKKRVENSIFVDERKGINNEAIKDEKGIAECVGVEESSINHKRSDDIQTHHTSSSLSEGEGGELSSQQQQTGNKNHEEQPRRLPSFSELGSDDISSLLYGDEMCSIDDDSGTVATKTCTQEESIKYSAAESSTSGPGTTMPLLLLGGRDAPVSVTTPDIMLTPWNAAGKDLLSKENATREISEDVQSEIVSTNDVEITMEVEKPCISLPSVSRDRVTGFSGTSPSESPIDKHFGGEVEKRLVCDSCSYTRTKTEVYRYFSLDINEKSSAGLGIDGDINVATVEESLKAFFAPEKLELKCGKCFCESATEYKEIVRVPNALLLHFKRFIVDFSSITGAVSFRKNHDRVEFNNRLDVAQYCNATATLPLLPSSKNEKQHVDTKGSLRTNYRLVSIVNHLGNSASCGHYTADASRIVNTAPVNDDDDDKIGAQSLMNESKWLHFNDETVTDTVSSADGGNETTALLSDCSTQSTAYMVMYELAV